MNFLLRARTGSRENAAIYTWLVHNMYVRVSTYIRIYTCVRACVRAYIIAWGKYLKSPCPTAVLRNAKQARARAAY